MTRRPLKGTLASARRAILSLALALAGVLLPWASGPAAPVRADAQVVRDHRAPAARLELVVRKIIIHDDRDWGEGEFQFTALFGPVDDSCIQPALGASTKIDWGWGSCMTQELVRSAPITFSANDGDARTVNRLLPSAGDTLHGDAAVGSGIPVAAQTAYGFELSGVEIDPLLNDDMGWTLFPLTAAADWGVGVHTIRGLTTTGPSDGVFGVPFGSPPAHYSVELEIRRAPLPDLVAASVGLRRLDDGRDAACMTAGNTGQRPAGSFEMSLRVDGAAITGGTSRWPSLAVGETREFCVVDGLPLGRHLLSFDVDLDRTVAEMDESNNHIDQSVTITSAASTAAAGASAAGASAASPSAAGTATPTPSLPRPAPGVRGATPTPGVRSSIPQP